MLKEACSKDLPDKISELIKEKLKTLSEVLYHDADYKQMGFACALSVITQYEIIDGVNVVESSRAGDPIEAKLRDLVKWSGQEAIKLGRELYA